MPLTESIYFAGDTKFIRDPVHRADIRLSPYEVEILNTRLFQRLRGIKQLGPCEVVWHCATHSRFQHSLGTLYMANRILLQLDPRGDVLPFAKKVVVRLFALLHDVGHLPFGHTIEDERPAIAGHHTNRTRIESILGPEIAPVLDQLGSKMDNQDGESIGLGVRCGTGKSKRIIDSLKALIIELICECKGETDEAEPEVPKELSLYLDIVGNTVCADLLDYLRRDTYNTGLRREYDDKIISDLHIAEGQLVLDLLSGRAGRAGSRSELINLMHVRHTLAERVYFNKTKIWASGMISKAIELAALPVEFLFDKRDDDLLWILENAHTWPRDALPPEAERPRCSGPDEGALAPSDSPWHDNSELLQRQEIAKLWSDAWRSMRAEVGRNLVGASKLAEAYKRRHIFRPVYSVSNGQQQWRPIFKGHFHDLQSQAFRLAMEGFIARLCGLEPWQIIICCPDPKMNLKFANPMIGPFPDSPPYRTLKQAREKETLDARVKALVEASQRVCDSHYDLWRFDVVVAPDLLQATLSAARGVCEAMFKLTNEANLGIPCSDNLKTVTLASARTAYAESGRPEPPTSELEALLAETEKDARGRGAVPPYFPEDFKRILKEREQ